MFFNFPGGTGTEKNFGIALNLQAFWKTLEAQITQYEMCTELFLNFMLDTLCNIYVIDWFFSTMILNNISDSYNTNRYFFHFLCIDRKKLRNIKAYKKKIHLQAHLKISAVFNFSVDDIMLQKPVF